MSATTHDTAVGVAAPDPPRRDARPGRGAPAQADWLLSYGRAIVLQSLEPERLSDGMAPPNVAIAAHYRVHEVDSADAPPSLDAGGGLRPMAVSCIHAAASPTTGKVTAWSHRIVAPGAAEDRKGTEPAGRAGTGIDGANRLPYALGPMRVEYVRHDTAPPVGHWRTPEMSFSTFAVECAMDELAAAIGWDPILFRLNNLADARTSTVLTMLRTLAGWGTVPGAGRARGVAIAAGPGGCVGQVAEVSTDAATGALTVHRVSTVIDCGAASPAETLRARVEAAVAQGIAATLWVGPRFVDVHGMPRNGQAPRARPARLAEMPQLDLLIVKHGETADSACGPCVSCIAPAIANAYARLKGPTSRVRALPFFPAAVRVPG